MSDAIDITQYADKLMQLASLLKKRYELVLSVDELRSAGYEALQLLAVSGQFDSAQGDFWAWAYKHVVNRMINEVSMHSGRTRGQQAARHANLAARATARPNAELSERERFMQRWAVVDGTAIGYQLDPEGELIEAERRQLDAAALERLLASLKRLPERQRSMIIQRYLNDDSLNAVAAANGISKSRASHLLRQARETLRLAVERKLELEP